MTNRYVALLRAINVGGKNKVAMADLSAMFVDLGFGNVETLLQSGNVLFSASRANAGARFEQQLEKASTKQLKLTVDYMIRSAEEWAAIVAANPFPEEAAKDPGHLLLVCLKSEPKPAAVEALRAAVKEKKGRESVRAIGPQLYVCYPDGIGRSKLTTGLIERTLGTSGTGRNWKTVVKLAGLLEPDSATSDG